MRRLITRYDGDVKDCQLIIIVGSVTGFLVYAFWDLMQRESWILSKLLGL